MLPVVIFGQLSSSQIAAKNKSKASSRVIASSPHTHSGDALTHTHANTPTPTSGLFDSVWEAPWRNSLQTFSFFFLFFSTVRRRIDVTDVLQRICFSWKYLYACGFYKYYIEQLGILVFLSCLHFQKQSWLRLIDRWGNRSAPTLIDR